ncbi:MAG TPA: DUF2380 domain-containing protein, partial [bacterium]|nr:DUF2380 domain-containing protein [bacterium]
MALTLSSLGLVMNPQAWAKRTACALLCVAGALGSAPLLWGQRAPALPAPTSPAPPSTRAPLIAVLDMEAIGSSKAQASAMSDRLREELLKSGRYTLVNRDEMNAVLGEQALQQTGCTSGECAVQVGKVLGVRKLVTGRVTRIDDQHWLLSAQVVDVETGETVRAESLPYEGPYFSLLVTGITSLAAKLTGQPEGAAPPGPPRPGRLSGQDLAALFGQPVTLDVINIVDAGDWSIATARPDGTLAIEWQNGAKSGRADARWTLRGDRFCIQGRSVNGGRERCASDFVSLGGPDYRYTGMYGDKAWAV